MSLLVQRDTNSNSKFWEETFCCCVFLFFIFNPSSGGAGRDRWTASGKLSFNLLRTFPQQNQRKAALSLPQHCCFTSPIFQLLQSPLGFLLKKSHYIMLLIFWSHFTLTEICFAVGTRFKKEGTERWRQKLRSRC